MSPLIEMYIIWIRCLSTISSVTFHEVRSWPYLALVLIGDENLIETATFYRLLYLVTGQDYARSQMS